MKKKFIGAFLAALLALSGQWPHVMTTAHAATNTGTICTASAKYDASTNGTTSIISSSSTMKIYVCGFDFFSAGTVSVQLVYGTGSSCTSSTTITPAFQFTAQTGLVDPASEWRGLPIAPIGSNICLVTNAGVAVQAIVYYVVAP